VGKAGTNFSNEKSAGKNFAADTDNISERTRSGFADLHFVARDQDCAF
jgi:hypothetical protein